MNKINFIIFELLNALQAASGIIKGHPSVNNVKKISFSKNFPKEKGKQKTKKVSSNPNTVLNPFRHIGKGKKVNDPKSKESVSTLGVSHWKWNCTNYLA